MYNNKFLYFAGLTFTLFFTRGSLFPLLSPFFKEKGFSGTQIGTIISIGMFIAVITQVLWGVLNDKFNKTKLLLSIMIVANIVAIIIFPFLKNYLAFIIIYSFFQFFLAGTNPVNDTMSLKSQYSFAKIRLWGSLGFATSTCIAAFLADRIHIKIIFVLATISLLSSLVFLSRIKLDSRRVKKKKSSLGMIKDLMGNRKYTTFLLAAFFIGGAIQGNNTFFGLLYTSLGGTITGIGVAFLFFAFSEAPVMTIIAKYKLDEKLHIESLLLFSCFIFIIRWFWYSTSPSPKAMLALFFLQGLSVGTYLACSAIYVKKYTKSDRTSTALSIFYAVSIGFSPMFYIYVSGVIMDLFGVSYVYTFYTFWTLIGTIIMIFLRYKNTAKEKKQHHFLYSLGSLDPK